MDTIKEMQEKFAKQQEIVAEIHETFPEISFPEIEEQLLARYSRGEDITSSKIMNNKSLIVGNFHGVEHEYGIISGQYKTVLHEEALHSAMQSVRAVEDILGKADIKVNVFADGARMKFTMDFPEYEKVPVAINDPVGLRISGTNSYDLGLEYRLMTEALVLKCLNGLIGGDVLEKYNSRHKGTLSLETSTNIVQQATIAFKKQTDIWNEWSKMALEATPFREIYEGLPFGEKHSKDILQLPIIQKEDCLANLVKAGQATLWDISLATSQFLTHEVESEMVRMDKGMRVAKHLQKASLKLAA